MQSVTAVILSITPYCIILIGLALMVITDTYIGKKSKKLMLAVLGLTVSLVFQNTADYLLNSGESMLFLRKIVGIWGYSARPAIIVLFISILNKERKNIVYWVLVGINTLIYLSAFFSPIVFTYSDSNLFVRGPLGYTCHVISGILLIGLVMLIIRLFSKNKTLMIMPFLSIIMFSGSVLIDSKIREMQESPVSALTISIIISCVFYFFWIHKQLVYEHENNLKAEQRIKIMISQIQPHFLYNTLSTIQALCLTNPKEASEITGKFGKYLRSNLDSLEQADLIPFNKELEHTRIYADIEKVRFPNITVVYDIKYDDFSLPALSVQPMVENSIHHGVRNREPGIITVSTEKKGKDAVITITDNGVGFDVKNAGKSGVHIGIENVRERIEKMCKGTFEVQSVTNKGTTITITIPKGEKG